MKVKAEEVQSKLDLTSDGSEDKQAKAIIPGAIARKDVKKLVDEIGEEVNHYYKPGVDWIPTWLDKPDLDAPQMARSIIKEIARQIKKQSPMLVNDVDLSLDAASGFKTALKQADEKKSVQFDFYRQQYAKLKDDKIELEGNVAKQAETIHTLNSKIDSLNEDIKDLEATDIKAAKEHAENLKELQQLENNLKGKDVSIKLLHKQIEKLISEKKTLESELKAKSVAKSQLNIDLVGLSTLFTINSSEELSHFKGLVDDKDLNAIKAGFRLAINALNSRFETMKELQALRESE